MKSLNNKSLYILLICLLFSACKKSEDDKVSIEKTLSSFTILNLQSSFDVYLVQDTLFKIIIEGDEKIVTKINLSYNDSILTIKNDAKLSWLSPKNNKIKLTIHLNGLKKIIADETCYITSQNTLKADELGIIMSSKLNEADLTIDCNTFYYWNNQPCGGRLRLHGRTYQLKVWNFALMAVDAADLNADRVLVENSSKGDCRVKALSEIEYSIFGEGNIYLYGNPNSINLKEITSTGKFIRIY